MADFPTLLSLCSSRHSHLCPRQVLGVRMALAAGKALGLDLPCPDKTLIVIAETDGCFTDGLEVAAGVSVGHRTLRVEDYGKVAAVFASVRTGESIRLAPRLDVRERAYSYAPDEKRHYFAQLRAYQVMPDDELFSLAPVCLIPPIERIVSRAGVRVNCCACGEEIINEREIIQDGLVYCRSCFGQGYYQMAGVAIPVFAAGERMEATSADFGYPSAHEW